MPSQEPKRETPEERPPGRSVEATLPAALEDPGRAEELVHGRDVHPSGARPDHRHSVPGTMIPGGPHPAAEGDEWERIHDAAERRTG